MDWSNQRCFIVAGGPSLTNDDVNKVLLSDHRIMVINSSFYIMRDADVLFACDRSWWRVYLSRVQELFKGQAWSTDESFKDHHYVNYVEGVSGCGMPEADGRLKLGTSSIFPAIQLAAKWGCRDIVLLGYDCKLGPNNKKHWFGNHPYELDTGFPFELWQKEGKILATEAEAEGVSIVNCSPDTADTAFKRGNLGDYLY